MEDFITNIKKNNEFSQEEKEKYNKLKSMNLTNKAAAAQSLLVDNFALEKCINLMGDTINVISEERDIFKEEVEKIGKYNSKEVEDLLARKKKPITNEAKNKRIMAELNKTIAANKPAIEEIKKSTPFKTTP